MAGIEIYLTSWCPYCQRATALLREKGQVPVVIDVEEEPGRWAEMTQRSGRRTVPQIWIGERHIGGYDDLAALAATGALDALLAS